MIYKKSLLLVASILISLSAISQEKKELSPLQKDYKEYFQLDREAFFLHLNKTVFIPEEDLWFSAYAFNPKRDKPNNQTTNLHIKLLSPQAKGLDSKTIWMHNGNGSGHFNLEGLAPGTYKLVAHTNYMKNFKEEYFFDTEFTILPNDSIDTPNIPQEKFNSYDLQFLPEGGHLIADAKNNIGVKLTDKNGNGIQFSEAKITNDTGELITEFKSNQFGIGKFRLDPKFQENYTVEITTFSGKKIKQQLEPAERSGFSMITNNLIKDKIIIEINTNNFTLEKIKGRTYYLAIHKNGILEQIPFQFKKEQISKTISITRDVLSNGVNYLTVFDDKNQPILERIIFNSTATKEINTHAYLFKNNIDSLQINMSSPALKKIEHNLSISVLPANNKAYNPADNIKSAFLLAPYTKGKIEDGAYYFTEVDRRKEYNLDLLLLTQGWSKYKWNHIFSNPPSLKFDREKGFSISGRVNESLDDNENQLFVSSEESRFMETVDLKNNSFKVENLYVEDSSQVSFSLVNSKNKKVSKPKIYANIGPNRTKQPKVLPGYIFQTNRKSQATEEVKIPSEFLKGIESLDSVYISNKKKEVDREKKEILSNQTLIDEDLASIYIYITDYIGTQGFRVKRSLSGVEIVSTRSLGLGGYESPLIYLDGVVLNDYGTILQNLKTSQVESISINKTGLGFGMRGNAGVIKINTKTTIDAGPIKNTSQSITANVGFSSAKEFYTPRYASYTSEIYRDYGVIDWLPNVTLEDGQKTFSIQNTLQDSIILYIEGMTENGDLISDIIKVDIH
ncbi:hypothetical protein [Mesonia aquimarina]|uniref:hypothetical protein n=1 Tax=Mesonia aquimarina TaxID=1504967 RepID=UPI000EF622FF|nr:hypothetical protein [Mesonia aquimarina]